MSEQVSVDTQLFRMGQALANEQLETIRQRERAERAEADLADEKRRRAAEIAEAWERGHEVCEWPGCARTHVNPYALLDTATEETQGAP